ncbi:peroxiredoxin [Flavobacteriaceae bacterium]|nr:peroxiredoxin [Flavobacteriaceae bacterium]
MTNLNIGDLAPSDIKLNKILKNTAFVLYFYPKDDTPGCTIEANDFSGLVDEFNAINVQIYGISKDNEQSHDKFISKYSLRINLIADEDKEICQKYDILKEKSMFGKKYIGIDRVTFFIDQNGIIKKIWKSVKAKGHAKEVLNYIKNESLEPV